MTGKIGERWLVQVPQHPHSRMVEEVTVVSFTPRTVLLEFHNEPCEYLRYLTDDVQWIELAPTKTKLKRVK